MADALGWPTVPITVLREGPEGPGSVQRFVEFDPQQHFFTMQDERPDDFRRVALFDTVVNNADRKSGHCLLSTEGLPFCIDHGVCFHEEPKLRTVIWDFAGHPLPGERLDAVARLAAAPPPELAALLEPEEIEALVARTSTVLRRRTFPAITSARAYPWPLV